MRCCSDARTIPISPGVIGDVMGPHVTLVSSADETAFATRHALQRLDLLRPHVEAARPSIGSIRAVTSHGSPISAAACSGPSSAPPITGTPPSEQCRMSDNPQQGAPA